MFCQTCGKQTEESWKFCQGCGAALSPAAPAADTVPLTEAAPTSSTNVIGRSGLQVGAAVEVALSPPPTDLEAPPATATTAATSPPAVIPAPVTDSLPAPQGTVAPAAVPQAQATSAPPASAQSPAVPAISVQPAKRGRRYWIVRGGLALAAIAVVVAISLLSLGLLRTQDELSETRTNLAGTRDDLATRTSDLESTTANLVSTQGALDVSTEDNERVAEELRRERSAHQGTRRGLEFQREVSSGLRAELAVLETSLDETQSSLSQSQQRVVLQAGNIQTLKTCLSGVAVSLSYAAYELWGERV